MLLCCQDLVKRYDNSIALNHISFDVKTGEIIGIIGHKGAGKTSLLNVISGHQSLNSGTILFDGRSIGGKSPQQLTQLGLARTFQIAHPFGSLTLVDNVAMARMSDGKQYTRKQAIDLSYETLEIVGLCHKARIPVTRLSHAERKLLEIARALAIEPKLILLDEVFTGMNATTLDHTIQLIHHIQSSGVTILLVEHNLTAVLELSQRVLVLANGEKIADGFPEDVLKML